MPWSYTALTSFETCPKKHFHTRVEKDVPDPMGPEALWGTRVHAFLEDRLKHKTPLPDSVRHYEPLVARIEASSGDVLPERKVALTETLEPTEFFAPDVWCRGVLDVSIVQPERVVILDWKTGKRRPGSDQLELFAAIARQLHPETKRISTGFVWLKANAIDKTGYTPKELDAVWARFYRRVDRLEQALETGDFPPKPSGLCRRHCPVTHCSYHGE